ncbi:MAG: DUF1566 domain-containing protein [Lysobacterales bacterium]
MNTLIKTRARALSLAALLGTTACPSSQAAFGWLQLYQDGQRLLSVSEDESPFVLDEFVQIANVTATQWAHFGDVWSYIDDTGVVRASASTGDHNVNENLHGRATAQWRGSYTKHTASEQPEFTIHPTDLLLESLFTIDGGPTASAPPNSFARWQIDVSVCGNGGQRGALCRTVLNQETVLAGGVGAGKFYTLTRTQRVSRVNAATGALESGTDSGGPVVGAFDWGLPSEPVMYSTGQYTGEIPLPDVSVGAEYTLSVDLLAEVYLVEQGAEGRGVAEAIVANLTDVLASDSGLTINPEGTPAPSPARLCLSDLDPLRYADQGDGSIVDVYTGLAWQRCPLGYTLGDNGTPDMADDTCQLSGQTDYDWSTALTAAASNTLAGASWRLPNVKELATLVAECQSPAIEPQPFPGTAPELFWSSTPLVPMGERPDAMVVNFQTGLVTSNQRTQPAFVRLVRDSGDAPIAPLPLLTLGRAGVAEGDSGLTQLVFPILLSEPQDQPVTVDYSVTGISAQAGSDFTPISGTLTIAPDDVLGNVAVTVTGDTEVEGAAFNGAFSESVQLTLSNPSSNVMLAQSQQLGLIFDDEPVVSIRPAVSEQAFESAPSQALEIVLERAVGADVTVDYTTTAGSAEAGSDFAAINGQITLTPGQTVAPLPVTLLSDNLEENEEDFFVDLSNVVGNARLGVARARTLIIDDDGPGTMAAVNDTGTDYCLNFTSAAEEVCPIAGLPNQDGDLGLDVTQNDDVDGHAGFSFTKLDIDGNELPDNAFPEEVSCLRDEVTGLVWEDKNQNSPRDLHYVYWDYVWVNDSGVNDGGIAGTKPALGGDMCWDTVNCGDPTNPATGSACEVYEPMQCDTATFVQRVNEEALCGFTDWRLPSVEEAFTLLNLDTNQLAMHQNVFSNAFAPITWTNAVTAADPNQAWSVAGRTSSNAADTVRATDKSTHRPVRLVRGGSQP